MRLKNYILREAVVKQTDADVFLSNYAPVFMWRPKDGLVWSAYDKKSKIWRVYNNNKEIDVTKSKYYDEYKESLTKHTMITHYKMHDLYSNQPENEESWIRGRINPSGKEIYVHDLENRLYDPVIERRFDYFVDKAIDAVYKYMRKHIK